jgi:hypothetical protein
MNQIHESGWVTWQTATAGDHIPSHRDTQASNITAASRKQGMSRHRCHRAGGGQQKMISRSIATEKTWFIRKLDHHGAPLGSVPAIPSKLETSTILDACESIEQAITGARASPQGMEARNRLNQ